MQQQMTLGLPYRQTFDREDFILAPCNIDAVTWMDLQGCWSSHAFLIYGPKGCGKTHLSYMFSRTHIDAKELTEDIKGYLGLAGLEEVRVLVRYDVENLSDETFDKALTSIFSEPPVDDVYQESFPYE